MVSILFVSFLRLYALRLQLIYRADERYHKFWKWCAAQSYGAYIFHLLLMIALQYAVDGIWMGAFGKFMFIGVNITIASFVLTWLLRIIPGVKKVL